MTAHTGRSATTRSGARRWVPTLVAGVVLPLVLVQAPLAAEAAPVAATVPATASGSPAAPTLTQLVVDVAAALTDPVLLVDKLRVTTEYALASTDLLFGSNCTAAAHLRTAATILQADVARAPASLKPLVQSQYQNTVRLERDVVLASTSGCDRPDVISVDAGLKPSVPAVPDLRAGGTVPVGVLDDGRGTPLELVSNRLMLETNDPAQRAAFLARFGGTVTATEEADPTDPNLPARYQVRVDPARLVAGNTLAADLEALDPGWRGGVYLTSDDQTLRLLATAARAAREGFAVRIDPVATPDTIESGSTDELPAGATAPGGYAGGDAFGWTYLNDGSVQDTEVTNAWQLLRLSRRDANKLDLGVIDSGFSEPDLDDLNLFVGKGSDQIWEAGHPSSPWHGTRVADVMAGAVDNGRGAAGTGGPVARVVRLWRHGTGSDVEAGIVQLAKDGARVINISFGWYVPARYGALVGDRMQFAVRAAQSRGAMVFASAGNENRNVDVRDCGGFRRCTADRLREQTDRVPCETLRVTCAGSLANNSTGKADSSNWGDQDVDLWAPGRNIWTSPDPGCECDVAQMVSGTSYAAPFAAGVAALVRAADPDLSPVQVADVLRRTSRPGGDIRVTRMIYAGGAVRFGLPEPVVRITGPVADGAVLPFGSSPRFTADAFDKGLGAPTYTWTRNEQAAGTGAARTIDLAPGFHRIEVIAVFPDGTRLSDSITVQVGLPPASWRITNPADGSVITQRSLASGVSFATAPAGAGVRWYLDDATVPFATGAPVQHAFAGLAPGAHTVTARVSDGRNVLERTSRITVTDDSQVRTTVTITSPPDGQVYPAARVLFGLTATVTDTIPRTAAGCPFNWTEAPGDLCTRGWADQQRWTITNTTTGAVVFSGLGRGQSVTLTTGNYRATVEARGSLSDTFYPATSTFRVSG